MNIYRVTTAEEGSTAAYSRTRGIADSMEHAAALALDFEQPDDDDVEDGLQLYVLSVEFVAPCDFGTRE